MSKVDVLAAMRAKMKDAKPGQKVAEIQTGGFWIALHKSKRGSACWRVNGQPVPYVIALEHVS